MRARMLLILSFVSCPAIGACSSDGGKAPGDVTVADLRGRWARTLEPTSGMMRVLSFRARGRFHPAVATSSDVIVEYDVRADYQQLRHVGTYAVAAGDLLETWVWDKDNGDHRNPSALPVPIVAFKGDELELAERDGTVSTYTRMDDDCEFPVGDEGWRTRTLAFSEHIQHATPSFTSELMSAAIAADGALILARGSYLDRFDGECVPETANVNATAFLRQSVGGVHLVSGTGAEPAKYAWLEAGELEAEAFALPIAWRDIRDAADADGELVLLQARVEQSVSIVRGSGDAFETVTVAPPDLPLAFDPQAITHIGEGRVAFVGLGEDPDPPPGASARAFFLIEEGADGRFVAERVPVVDRRAVGAVLEADGDDRWVVHGAGEIAGSGGLQDIWLARRRAGVWSSQRIHFGATAELRVVDHVGHVVLGVPKNDLQAKLAYVRIEGDTVSARTLWRKGAATMNTPTQNLPAALLVDDRETVFIGYQGTLFERRPGDPSDTLGRARVIFDIQGQGRVTSDDGLVDCTATCTVTANVGERLIIHATPATPGTDVLFNIYDGSKDGFAVVEVGPFNPLGGGKPADPFTLNVRFQ